MKSECSTYRNQIPQGLMAELPEDQQKALERHLAECLPCAEERRLYRETLRQLQLPGDADVPRHFFVYPEESRATPWRLFRNLSLAWRGALSAVALAVLALGGFALANLEIRAEAGSVTIRLGEHSQPAPPPPPPTIDLAGLKSDLLVVLEEKSRNDKIEMIRTVRAELAQSETTLTKKQRLALNIALADMESRLDSRIVASAGNVEAGMQGSLAIMYRELDNQRTRDLTAINDRLNRIAVNGEIKSNQTDAILETLLQVAEFRLK